MLYENAQEIRKKNMDRMQIIRRITLTSGINIAEPDYFKDLMVGHAILVIVCSIVCVFGHVCFINRNITSVFKVTQSLCTLLQTSISIIKLTLWVFIKRRFYRLVKKVIDYELLNKVKILDKNNEWAASLRNKTKRILEDCWKRSQTQVYYYVAACVTVITFYFVNALVTNIIHDINGNTNHTKLFAFSTYYPYGLEEARQHLPMYAVFTVIDGYGDFAAGMIAATFDAYYVYLTFHAVALLKTLKEMINFSSSDMVPKDQKITYLRECVYHYNRSIKFIEELNSMYSFVNLSQLLISLVVLGVVLFQASVGLKNDPKTLVTMILYISAAGFELVIYCWDGQNITTETEDLSEAWYSTNWYDESREFKTIIYMMIVRTRRSYYISALGFTTMSLPTFLSIARTSGSYFILLRNVAGI